MSAPAAHPLPTRPHRARPDPVDRTVVNQVGFAVNTIEQGKAMSHSHDVRYVGSRFARLTAANDTRKVGAAYVRAFFKGDSQELNHLGETRLVQKVGDNYTQLGHSNRVKKVGKAFTNFGNTVAKGFKHLFG